MLQYFLIVEQVEIYIHIVNIGVFAGKMGNFRKESLPQLEKNFVRIYEPEYLFLLTEMIGAAVEYILVFKFLPQL